MTEVEKKGIGKAKVGLVVSAVLIVILAVSNVWSYTNLQNQINTLNNDKNNLQSQVNTLQSQIDSLNTTYQDYLSTHSHSNSEYAALQSQIQTLQTWLDGNISLLQTTIAERDQLQTWLDGNITNYESQINLLNTQITNLQSQIDSLNTTYQDYVSTHSHSNSEYDALQSEYNNYVATHHHTDSEYDALKAPKLSLLSLSSSDERPWLATPRLHVYGEVWNVGTDTAYSCKLHVVAYQGAVKAIDTYVSLGTIAGENRKSIDENIYYSGEALTSWSISAEWAN